VDLKRIIGKNGRGDGEAQGVADPKKNCVHTYYYKKRICVQFFRTELDDFIIYIKKCSGKGHCIFPRGKIYNNFTSQDLFADLYVLSLCVLSLVNCIFPCGKIYNNFTSARPICGFGRKYANVRRVVGKALLNQTMLIKQSGEKTLILILGHKSTFEVCLFMASFAPR
jgi:hypothetical protein